MGERLEGKRCQQCAYGRPSVRSMGGGVAYEVYVCKRYAPRPVHVEAGEWEWPMVDATDWCGEWQDGHR